MPRNPSRRHIRAKAGTTGITSAGQLVITAADAAAIRVVLELVIGTHVLAPNGNGSGLTGLTLSQISGLVAALAAKADAAATAAALAGKADLVAGKIQTSQIPSLAIVDYLGDVASQSAMLSLDGDRGDWCIRTDAQTAYILTADDSTQVGSWIALPHPTSPVLSVNGQTGVIVLGASDVGAQPADATLTALAGVATSSDKLIYATGADTFATTTLSSFARTFLDDADAAAVLATIGAQPISSVLTAITAAGVGAPNLVLRYNPGVGAGIAWGTLGPSCLSAGCVIDSKVSAGIDAVKIGAGTVSNTEFGCLDGATENIQSRLDALRVESTTVEIASPTVSVIRIYAKARYAFTVNGVYGIRTTSGTATAKVTINGTAVTGLSAISVTSTTQDVAASGANTVAVGDIVALEFTAVSSASEFRMELQVTRS